MSFKTALLAAALAVSSFAASAGTLPELEIHKEQETITKSGPFTYNYFYELGFDGPADLGFALTELKFKNYTDIDFSGDGAGVFIYATDAGFGNDSLVWSGTPTATSGPADSLSWNGSVTGGHFQVTIIGAAVGTSLNKGSFSFELIAAPVPEAQSYAMALAGLGVAGLMVRRRRQG